MGSLVKNRQYYKFSAYGFLKNLRFFDAFFILFLVEKGLPYTQIGILYAIREICIQVFELPSGLIADTYGRKNALMASFIAYILSFIAFYLSESFWVFLAAFVLYGMGDAFRSGTHKGMIMDYLKIKDWEDQKISYYGHTRSWSQNGSALSSLLAGLIVFYSGNYQHIFLYSVIPYLLNLFLIWSYPKELNRSGRQAVQTGKYRKPYTLRSFLENIRKASVLRIINTAALHTAYLRAVKDYIQPLMVQVALLIPIFLDRESAQKNGIVIGLIYFLIYLLTSAASRLSYKVPVQNKTRVSSLTLFTGFAFGIICGLSFYLELWIISLLAFVGIYLIENIRKPILTGFVADQVPNDILTSVISAQSLLRTLITAVLALVFGLLADRHGIGISFLLVSSLLAASTLLMNWFGTINGGKRT